jgi:dihydropteroate synthase
MPALRDSSALIARIVDRDAPPLVMGILNVTPDSFSDGGEFLDVERAVRHGVTMARDGAGLVDVGGESTRPGSAGVSDDEQIARVVPVITALATALPDACAISIDARSARVANAAIVAGATLVNDVSAGADPAMGSVVAASGVPIVLMHMQGTPETMQLAPSYADVVNEVRDFLLERAARLERDGVARRQIVLDPGIGFGKTRRHNLELLSRLDVFVASGYPVLLGTSRKRFMGAICRETEPRELVGATCATTALGVDAGVRLVRVHDVRENRQALEVVWAIRHPE